MGKIIRENGNIWLEEKQEFYGVESTRRMLIGTYEEETNEEKPKKVKKKKSEE